VLPLAVLASELLIVSIIDGGGTRSFQLGSRAPYLLPDHLCCFRQQSPPTNLYNHVRCTLFAALGLIAVFLHPWVTHTKNEGSTRLLVLFARPEQLFAKTLAYTMLDVSLVGIIPDLRFLGS
jgi:hypothetical protein